MEENIGEEKTQSTERETSQVHGEIQMQWVSIEGEEGTGSVISVGSLAIWPKIVGKETEQE